jgi:hypothetical protein
VILQKLYLEKLSLILPTDLVEKFRSESALDVNIGAVTADAIKPRD